MIGQVTHNIAKSPAAEPAASAAWDKRHEALVKQTQKWVGMTFYGTMLKQMRQDPFRSKLLDGGEGGQAFGSMYDQEIAERLGRGTANNLVQAIVSRIEGNKSGSYGRQMNIGRDARVVSPGKVSGYVATDLRA